MLKKTLALLFCLSQVSMVSVANASIPSPELSLLQSLVALSGSALSSADLNTSSATEIQNYMATAPATGQIDRMEQALVEMNIYTPGQAASVAADIRTASQRVASADPGVENAMMTSELQKLIALHPSGAQFSFSDCASLVGFGLFIADIGISSIPRDPNVQTTVAVAGVVGIFFAEIAILNSGFCS